MLREKSFKSLLFIPNTKAFETFNSNRMATENIKLYIMHVFITDDFKNMSLPLNVSRETLQQHLKVIKKTLVHKTLDMIKQIPDTANSTKLAKMLRFTSSSGRLTSLDEYVKRMKDKQKSIYYISGGSKKEVSSSPFVEQLLKKDYEVVFLTEDVDEYATSSLPEFEEKKFQKVAKEGFNLDGDTESPKKQAVKKKFKSLTKWLSEDALKDYILHAEFSERLVTLPVCSSH